MKLSPEIVSALQEFLRTFILAMVIPVGSVLLIINSGIDITVGGFNINWMLALSVLISGVISAVHTSLLSAVDKYVHKNGVRTVLDFKALDSLK